MRAKERAYVNICLASLFMLQLIAIYWLICLSCRLRCRRRECCLRQELSFYLDQEIVVQTNAGAISGVLTEVGEDVITLTEASGNMVLILCEKINSFSEV